MEEKLIRISAHTHCYYSLFCWQINLLLAENNENLISTRHEQAPTSSELPLSWLKFLISAQGA